MHQGKWKTVDGKRKIQRKICTINIINQEQMSTVVEETGGE